MARGLKYDIRFAERLITEYVTCSRLVTPKPCYLFSSLVTPHAFSADCQARLRNGEMVTSDILLNFKSQYEQCTHDYHPPVYFNRGLYVELVGEILLLLDDCGDTLNIEDWVELNDGLNPVDETTLIKQGSHSMALGIDADKDAADYSGWDKWSLTVDLTIYQHDWVYLWVYISTLDYLGTPGVALAYYIGTTAGNLIYQYFFKANLVVGWNLLKLDCDNPTGLLGAIDWTDIRFQRIRVYEIVGNTNDFTVYIDSIMFVRPFSGATDGITEGVTVQYLIE